MTRPAPFYRSPVFRLTLIIAGLTSSWTCLFGPKPWRNTPGLQMVRSYGLPWWVWGVAFLAFAAMLTVRNPKWNARGDWLGLFLYSIVFLSVLASARTDRPTNLVISSLALIGLVALYQAAKLATFDREGL